MAEGVSVFVSPSFLSLLWLSDRGEGEGGEKGGKENLGSVHSRFYEWEKKKVELLTLLQKFEMFLGLDVTVVSIGRGKLFLACCTKGSGVRAILFGFFFHRFSDYWVEGFVSGLEGFIEIRESAREREI